MFTHKTYSAKHWWAVANLFGLAALVLSACSSSNGIPLQITNVSVSPEPIVGQIVTLQVEIMSTRDESDVMFKLNTLEEYGNKLHLVSGNPEWSGALMANQPQVSQFSVCVWEEGSWPIEISVVSYLHDAANNGWHAFETINLESSINSGRLIRSKDYEINPGQARPTPRPVTVSDECAGR